MKVKGKRRRREEEEKKKKRKKKECHTKGKSKQMVIVAKTTLHKTL